MNRMIKKLGYLLLLLCSAVVLICMAGCDLAGDTEDDSDTEVTSSLELTGFTYGGSNDVYFTLYGSEGPGSGTAPVHSQKLSDGISDEDIVFEDLNIEEHDDGEEVQLYIASDEDGSGTLDTGDYIMPILRFNMYYGEYRRIPYLILEDLQSGIQSGEHSDNISLRIHINYGQLGPVTESSPLVLRIRDGNTDLTNEADATKNIKITDKGFINEIEFQCYFNATQHFILLFHDENGNGTAETGEAASENSLPTAISESRTFTGTDDFDVDLTVSKDTPLQ
jgi:hypothetical protein